MQEWISGTTYVNVCIIVKTHRVDTKRIEFIVEDQFLGDWEDLVFTLYDQYGIFADELDHLERKQRNDQISKIANRISTHDRPYEFKLQDGSDDWYLAYCKQVPFRLDPDGNLW
jgi:hypothetical protein